jgi:hypothetical protein
MSKSIHRLFLSAAWVCLAATPAYAQKNDDNNGFPTIRVRLDTSGLRGHFPGRIKVFLNDASLPEADLSFEGQIVPLIEVSPAPAFFVGARRG